MSELKNKTTTELKVLQDKIKMELDNRVDEVEIPVIKMISHDDTEYFDFDSIGENARYLNEQMKLAIKDKNRIFSLKIAMIPESDYKDMKENGEI